MENTSDQNDNKDKYFKGQQKNEEFVCFFRHHWITLLREFLYFIIFISIYLLAIANFNNIQDILQGNREMKMFFFTGYLVATIYIHRFFIKMLNYFVNIGIITNIRIVDHNKTIFFTDTQDAIDMAQIQNLEKVEQGLLPNVLRYGTLKIYLNASNSVKIFEKVPNAKFHFRCLNRQKEARQLALVRDRAHETINNNLPTSQIPTNISQNTTV